MSVNNFIADFFSPLGMSFSDLMLFGAILVTIIFWAQDIRYGLLIQFILFAFLIVWEVGLGINPTKTIIVFFIVLILMTLSQFIGFAKDRTMA